MSVCFAVSDDGSKFGEPNGANEGPSQVKEGEEDALLHHIRQGI